MSLPLAEIDATRYEVSCLPLGHRGRRHFTVTVEWRSVDSWAVLNSMRECYSRREEWDYESRPSERADEWIAEHRWGLEEALVTASNLAPHLTVMRYDVQHAIDHPEMW